MTKEEKVQIALGVKFECPHCKKIFTTLNQYSGCIEGSYFGIFLHCYCKECVRNKILKKMYF